MDTVISSPADPPKVKRRPPNMWTPEVAALMRLKSAESRRRTAAERRYQQRHPPQPTPTPSISPLPTTTTSTTQSSPASLDPYVSSRLMRVRSQLDRIDRLILETSDARDLANLAVAQARLSDQEWELSGRAKLGSKKPHQDPAPPSAKTELDL